MRLEIKGHLDATEEFADTVLDDALTVWVKKIAKDNPDMNGMLEKVEAVEITSLTAEMCFKLEDNEDWQIITTDNHEGIPELLTVTVETDEQGNLLTDSVKDNDGDSGFNEIEALIAAGNATDLKPAKTAYDGVELEYKEEFDFGNIAVYILTDPDNQVVVQANEFNVFHDTRLVAEAVFPQEKLADIIAHYRELKEAAQ